MRMLDFLKVPYDEKDVKLKLYEDFGTFHRPSSSFEHYTMSQRAVIQQYIKGTLYELQAKHKPTLGLESYT